MKNNLKNFRQEKGLTQVQIAEKANVAILSLQRYETGKRVPNAYTAQRIAKILNTSVENLFPLSTEEKHNLTT